MRVLCFVVFWLCCSCYPDFQNGLDRFEKEFPGVNRTDFDNAFVPTNEGAVSVNARWYSIVVNIRNKLGDVPRGNIIEVITWENTADSVLELNTLAKEFAPFFNQSLVNVINGLNDTFISYGPNNSFITKSLTSMENKRDRMLILSPNSQPWRKMDDSLRGTIVIKRVDEFAAVITRLKDPKIFPYELSCDNKFSDGRAKDSGYVGVHCKIMVRNSSHAIQTELQIHFYDIMDGTTECPKEFTHTIYEITRTLVLDDSKDNTQTEQDGNKAQKVVFLFGLNRTDPGAPHVHDNLTDAEAYYYMWGALFRKAYSTFNYSHYEMFSAKLGTYFPVNCISGEQDSIGVTPEEAREIENHLYKEPFYVNGQVFIGVTIGALLFGLFAGCIVMFNYRKSTPQDSEEKYSDTLTKNVISEDLGSN